MSMDDFFKYELPRIKRMESEAFYTLAREKGYQEGLKIGLEEVSVSTAKNLLSEGMSIASVVKNTKLSLEKVTILAKELGLTDV